MAINKALLIASCLVLVQSAFTMSNTNNGIGNTGGGIHGRLNGRQGVANSRIREFLPAAFKHVIPQDSEEESEPVLSRQRSVLNRHRQAIDTGDDASPEDTKEVPETTVFVKPVVKEPQGFTVQGGRGNNNGNNNNDGRSHGNGCNTNNNGNNNEDDDCQGSTTKHEQVTVRVPPAPVSRKRPTVDHGNDGAAGLPGPDEPTSDEIDMIEEELDNFDIDDSDLGDNEDRYPDPEEDNGDDDSYPNGEDDDGDDSHNRFDYRSLFSNSRLARLSDYRYWLRRFLPRFREYYRSKGYYRRQNQY